MLLSSGLAFADGDDFHGKYNGCWKSTNDSRVTYISINLKKEYATNNTTLDFTEYFPEGTVDSYEGTVPGTEINQSMKNKYLAFNAKEFLFKNGMLVGQDVKVVRRTFQGIRNKIFHTGQYYYEYRLAGAEKLERYVRAAFTIPNEQHFEVSDEPMKLMETYNKVSENYYDCRDIAEGAQVNSGDE